LTQTIVIIKKLKINRLKILNKNKNFILKKINIINKKELNNINFTDIETGLRKTINHFKKYKN
jgi:hypothetical protein